MTPIISATAISALTISPAAARAVTHRPNGRDVVIQTNTIQPVRRGIDDLTAPFIVRMLANFPFARTDLQRRYIVIEAIATEVGNALVEAKRGTAFIGIRVERHRAIARAIMPSQRALLLAVMTPIVRIRAMTRPAEAIGAVAETRTVITVGSIARRIAIMVDADTRAGAIAV